jgi:hypothetical protein
MPSEDTTTAGQTAPVPAALSNASQRFLQAMTGIDPRTVAIARARPESAPRGAAALSLRDAVVVSAPGSLETPERLGLLAHELTHVARHRQPRFVPPVAREAASAGQASSGDTSLSGTPVGMDEERLARRVEARVIAEVRRQVGPLGALPRGFETITAGAGAAEEPESPEQQGGHMTEIPEEPGTVWPYAGLPAPWEPLPDWLASPAASPGDGEGPAGAIPSSTGIAAAVAAPEAAPATSGTAAAAHLAATGRPLPTDERRDQPSSTHSAGDPPAVEPDLDSLARQVYTVLRRRLAAEIRQAY